jgi:hypothetical protein
MRQFENFRIEEEPISSPDERAPQTEVKELKMLISEFRFLTSSRPTDETDF